MITHYCSICQSEVVPNGYCSAHPNARVDSIVTRAKANGHDTKRIGLRHPNGDLREVRICIDGLYHVRATITETLQVVGQNAPRNDHLRDGLARGAVSYQIDLPNHMSRDERHLMFGQNVTFDELRDIATRPTTRKE